jgi:transposase
VEFNPTRMCELLVGLPEVNVLAVDDRADGPVAVHIESRFDRVWCPMCGVRAGVKERPVVELVDLPCFGRPARLAWRKHRLSCPEALCPMGSWTHVDERIAAPKMVMTTRAARWATVQVGRHGRAVSDVAAELDCDWHTVNDAVVAYGEALLAADADRVGAASALGLDETLFVRTGRFRTQSWCTSITDVSPGRPARLIEIIEGRTAATVSEWIDAQPADWRDAIGWGVLDMSGPYRKVYDDSLPDAVQVADPFHVVKHANSKLDECRRRVQNETLGHRGRKDDPLYRGRRLLTKGHERLDERGEAKLLGLLEAGDPRGEVRMTWHAKETVRGLYDIADPDTAAAFLDELIDDMADAEMPVEVRSLAGTLRRWRDQIVAWHTARVSNGPTEALNNLIKRIKRVAFGMRRFRHYRVRVLLYAGRPNWDLLATITPR